MLRDSRQRRGLTQQELAALAGLSVGAVRDLEQGRSSRPRASSLRALADVLDLSPGQRASLQQPAPPHQPQPPAAGTVRVCVLGPLAVCRDGHPVPLGSGQHRAVLARLALTPNEPVGRSELIDLLWPASAPPSAVNVLQTNVSRLRRILRAGSRGGDAGLTLTAAGYRLQVDESGLDLLGYRARLDEWRRITGTDLPRGFEVLGSALDMWQGGSAVADVAELQHDPLVTALSDELVDITVRLADLGQALHRLPEVLPRLRRLAARYPWHEPLHARLVTALAASGQQAAALDAYDRIRVRLSAELGIDPGTELVHARQAVLAGGDPHGHRRGTLTRTGRRLAPAQLPPDLAGFTGREAHLAQLDQLLGARGQRGDAPTAIAVLAGTAGIGKTSLAVHWAHRVADRFPDGQLYVNLRGFHPTTAPMDPAEAVRGFLDALGVPVPQIPAGLDAQVGLYRSLLAGRRVLVVLDNARTAEQVRPLLPGSAGCLALVTSRNELASLIATHDATSVAVDLLSTGEAYELITRRLGHGRTAADPDATDRIVRRCARLPLALAIAAARAAVRRTLPLAAVADELAEPGTGLDGFAAEDPAGNVRAVFSWSYRVLSAPAARVFRLLAEAPGPDITVPAAASLAGLPVGRIRPLLAELATAHLVVEHTPGRYTCHDLLRTYAAELAGTVDSAAERRSAVQRILDHYLHTGRAAALLLEPTRLPIAVPPMSRDVVLEEPAGPGEALAWFTAQHDALLGAITLATRTRFDEHVEPLAWAVTDYLQRQGRWLEQLDVHRAALGAASRRADLPARSRAHRRLIRAYVLLGRFGPAEEHYRRALALASALGDLNGLGHTHLNLVNLRELQGRHDRAAGHAALALELFRRAGVPAGRARALNALGWSLAKLGNHRRALAHCWQAIRLARELGDLPGEAYTWDSIGHSRQHLGDLPGAVACYRRSLALVAGLGDRYVDASVSVHLGDALDLAGDRPAAEESWRHALALLDDIGHPDAGPVRARLAPGAGWSAQDPC